MITVRLFDHPFTPAKPREFAAESIGEWLLSHYGEAPNVTVQVFRGEPSRETEITGNLHALLANDAPVYTVLQSPGDPITVTATLAPYIGGAAAAAVATAAGFVAAYGSYIVLAANVASTLLSGNRSQPANVNRTSSSPNNSLGARDNQVRLLQRIEDIYGTVRSVPSLMMPPYEKYINHRLVQYGYYCVTRGYAFIDDIRDGETLIADIPGSSAAVYAPFTSPNSGHAPQLLIGDAIIDDIPTVRRAVEVDGITLKAANQVQLAASGTYTFTADAGGDIITQADKNPNFASVAEAGDEVTITMTPIVYVASASPGEELHITAATPSIKIVGTLNWEDIGPIAVGDSIVLAGFTNAANNRTATVTSIIAPDELGLSGTGYSNETRNGVATATWTRDFSGTRIIDVVNDGSVVLSDSVWPVSQSGVTAAVQLSDKDHRTGWVTIPTLDRTQVWCNIVAVQGMFRDSGGKSVATTAFTIEVERMEADSDGDLVPTGTVETVNGSLSGATTDERAVTIEHVTAWTGPCRVRMYRTTAYDYGFNGTIVDEIKWRDLSGVSPVSQADFGPLTTIQTITKATARATSSRARQLRCIAARLLPTYDGTRFSGQFNAEGRLIEGAIYSTSRVCDIIPAVMIDPAIGNRSIEEVDMANLYAAQQALDDIHPDAGTFNYTLDSFAPLEETLAIIADAAFSRAYRQLGPGGKVRLAVDRAQATSSAQFVHRNKEPKSETLTRTFIGASEFDGVEFVYQDPDTETAETIRIPTDGSALKPKPFELPGIRSFAQAWLRASREYAKLKGRRLAIEVGCLSEARALVPGQRIDIVDNTRYKAFGGDVVGQDGFTLTLSEPVEANDSDDYSIILTKRDGSLQSIPCTPGDDPRTVVLSALPDEAVVTEYGADGVRTLYSFAADSTRGSMAYLVQEVDPPRGRYVTVRAINYSDDYYAADSEPIPPKSSIIN